MKLIFVDDDDMQKVCADLVDYPAFGRGNVLKFGYDISLAKEFLMQKGDEIDIALLDQFIGDERGTELGAWINRHFPHIACILLTGGGPDKHSSNQSLLNICRESMEKGFTAFMLKSHECTDKKILHKSLDRILALPSIEGKQKAKQDKLLGTTLFARLMSKYQECDLYAMEFCLHSIELIAKLHYNKNKNYETDILFYSRCFKRVEEELKSINLKDTEIPEFSLILLGNPHNRKRYAQKMEDVRKYFADFKSDDITVRDRILSGRSTGSRANNLFAYFNKERNEEIAYILLMRNEQLWPLTRAYFLPIKKIIEKFNLPGGTGQITVQAF